MKKRLLACLLASSMVLSASLTVAMATDVAEEDTTIVSEEVVEDEAVDAVSEEAAEEVADEDAEEATDEDAEEVTEEVTDEDAEEATDEDAEEATDEDAEEVTDEDAEELTEATAEPTPSTVLVDGVEVAFDAYKINNNNYFKLRDVAYALNGTVANFEVTWNEEADAIELVSASAYTEVGGEMELGDGANQTAEPTESAIYLDGEEISLTAYKINDNNYFKLRDLGETFGFNVSWDEEANTITVASDEEYTAD